MSKFYITTAIDYVNGDPHIGHALEKLQADVLARWHRVQGDDVYFLGGTDENAQKNVVASEKSKMSVEDFVERNSEQFQKMANLLSISYDQFIHTSDKEVHWPGVEELWKRIEENGDIYKKEYEGLYCVGCEAFVTEKDLNEEGQCPDHLKEPEEVSEENHFFRLSEYEDQLEEIIKSDQLKIVPEKRKNETLNFIRSGLNDISISRPTERMKGWGVPVPGEEGSIIYVWLDALSNYITALGFGRDEELFDKFWSADVHLIGKGISRFHAIFWPAFLLSAEIELPNEVFVHDYVTVDGQKMSKTIGNVVNPIDLVEKYGSGAVRYFFLREISPFQDGDFTYERFEERYSSDLAKGLGNLTSRVLTMAVDRFDDRVKCKIDDDLEGRFKETKEEVDKLVSDYKFHEALQKIWELVSFSDKYIDEKKPWETGSKKVLKRLMICLSQIAFLLTPFLPETSKEILSRLGVEKDKPWSFKVEEKGDSLFPRI